MDSKYDDIVEKKPKKTRGVNIQEPMFFWILLLVIAVVLKIILSNTQTIPPGTQLYSAASSFSNFLLNIPGLAILPLIIGGVIGAEVGLRSSSMKKAMRSGILNGIYASVIYIITILVIYIIIDYAVPQFSSTYYVLLDRIIIPVAVLLIVTEVFSILSYSRRVESTE